MINTNDEFNIKELIILNRLQMLTESIAHNILNDEPSNNNQLTSNNNRLPTNNKNPKTKKPRRFRGHKTSKTKRMMRSRYGPIV
jgi:hypothetical protein